MPQILVYNFILYETQSYQNIPKEDRLKIIFSKNLSYVYVFVDDDDVIFGVCVLIKFANLPRCEEYHDS